MVGVKGVPQPERIGQATQAKHDRVAGRDQQQHDPPADQVQKRNAAEKAGQSQ